MERIYVNVYKDVNQNVGKGLKHSLVITPIASRPLVCVAI